MELAVHDVRFKHFNDPAPRRTRLKWVAQVLAAANVPPPAQREPVDATVPAGAWEHAKLDEFIAKGGNARREAAILEQVPYADRVVAKFLSEHESFRYLNQKEDVDDFNGDLDQTGYQAVIQAVDGLRKRKSTGRNNPKAYISLAVVNEIREYVTKELNFWMKGVSYRTRGRRLEKERAIQTALAAHPYRSDKVAASAAKLLVEPQRITKHEIDLVRSGQSLAAPIKFKPLTERRAASNDWELDRKAVDLRAIIDKESDTDQAAIVQRRLLHYRGPGSTTKDSAAVNRIISKELGFPTRTIQSKLGNLFLKLWIRMSVR